MNHIGSIFGIATKIYAHVGEVKYNTKDCQDLAERVKDLEPLLKNLQEKGEAHITKELTEALGKLQKNLEEADTVIEKYTSDNFSKKCFAVSKHRRKFKRLNDRLTQASQVLDMALNMQANEKIYKVASQQANEKREEAHQRAEEEAARKEGPKKMSTVQVQAHSKQDAVDAKTVSGKTDAEKECFVVQNMAQLIQKVKNVRAIVETLKTDIEIHDEIYEEILAETKRTEQMRTLNSRVLQPGARRFKVAFYNALKQHESGVLEKLEEMANQGQC